MVITRAQAAAAQNFAHADNSPIQGSTTDSSNSTAPQSEPPADPGHVLAKTIHESGLHLTQITRYTLDISYKIASSDGSNDYSSNSPYQVLRDVTRDFSRCTDMLAGVFANCKSANMNLSTACNGLIPFAYDAFNAINATATAFSSASLVGTDDSENEYRSGINAYSNATEAIYRTRLFLAKTLEMAIISNDYVGGVVDEESVAERALIHPDYSEAYELNSAISATANHATINLNRSTENLLRSAHKAFPCSASTSDSFIEISCAALESTTSLSDYIFVYFNLFQAVSYNNFESKELSEINAMFGEKLNGAYRHAITIMDEVNKIAFKAASENYHPSAQPLEEIVHHFNFIQNISLEIDEINKYLSEGIDKYPEFQKIKADFDRSHSIQSTLLAKLINLRESIEKPMNANNANLVNTSIGVENAKSENNSTAMQQTNAAGNSREFFSSSRFDDSMNDRGHSMAQAIPTPQNTSPNNNDMSDRP